MECILFSDFNVSRQQVEWFFFDIPANLAKLAFLRLSIFLKTNIASFEFRHVLTKVQTNK